jgi:hypothetical protein
MKSILIALMFGMLLNLGVASRANAATDKIDPKVASLVTVTHTSKGCMITAKPGVNLFDASQPTPAGLSGVRVTCHGSCVINSTSTTETTRSCKFTVQSGSPSTRYCEGCADGCWVALEASK